MTPIYIRLIFDYYLTKIKKNLLRQKQPDELISINLSNLA